MSSSGRSSKPLKNLVILVACSAKKMVELKSGLESMGGEVLPFPVIEIQAIEDTGLLDKALDSLCDYSWIIFTSVYGVHFFMKHLKERGIIVNRESIPNVCSIGPSTRAALEEFGWKTTVLPKNYVAEGVLEALDKYHGGLQHLAGRRVLLPRAKEAREILPETLTAAGVHVDVVPCYRTVLAEINENTMKQLQDRKPDLLVFTSSSTIKNMIEILGREVGEKILLESTVAVLGPVTGDTARFFGKRAEIVPETHTIVALLKAIGDHYSGQSSISRSCIS